MFQCLYLNWISNKYLEFSSIITFRTTFPFKTSTTNTFPELLLSNKTPTMVFWRVFGSIRDQSDMDLKKKEHKHEFCYYLIFNNSISKNVVLVLGMNEAAPVVVRPYRGTVLLSRSASRSVAGLFSKEHEFLVRTSKRKLLLLCKNCFRDSLTKNSHSLLNSPATDALLDSSTVSPSRSPTVSSAAPRIWDQGCFQKPPP